MCECRGFVSRETPENLHQSEEVRPGRGSRAWCRKKRVLLWAAGRGFGKLETRREECRQGAMMPTQR